MEVNEAIERVLELGKDGMEHAVVLAPDGRVTLAKDGEKDHVNFDPEVKKGDVFYKGGKIIHNHPLPVSLSMADLDIAARMGCEIWAVTEDGSRFWSWGFKNSYGLLGLVIRLDGDLFKQEARRVMLENCWTHDDMNLVGEHFQNLYFKKQGYLVSYDFKLSERHQELAGRFQQDLLRTDSFLKDLCHV